VPLSFLDKGRPCQATIYTDGGENTVVKAVRQVNSATALELLLPASGGAVINIQ
jgi:hypothetical protein